MDVMKGKYFKIISQIVNGKRYYFVCNSQFNGFSQAYAKLEEAIRKLNILESYMEYIEKYVEQED